jgi:hypothetical protein
MPSPLPTEEPVNKKPQKTVRFANGEPNRKKTKTCTTAASKGEANQKQHDENCAISNRPTESEEKSGKEPIEDDDAPSQALNDSPGLSPNVVENELQLPESQEPARTLGEGVNSMNTELIQPCLVQAMSVEIFRDPYDNMLAQGEIFCLEMMHPNWNSYDESGGPLAMKASADPDMMYHHQAMREPDRDEFKKAMQ